MTDLFSSAWHVRPCRAGSEQACSRSAVYSSLAVCTASAKNSVERDGSVVRTHPALETNQIKQQAQRTRGMPVLCSSSTAFAQVAVTGAAPSKLSQGCANSGSSQRCTKSGGRRRARMACQSSHSSSVDSRHFAVAAASSGASAGSVRFTAAGCARAHRVRHRV